MRLSTAIRIGSITTKQIRVRPWDGGNGYCALGAALFAIGVEPSETDWPNQVRFHFVLSETLAIDPVAKDDRWSPLMDIIWRLNDSAEWTREQIADFVEAVELKEEKSFLPTKETALHE